MKKVIVITPTTGAPELADAVKSVGEQTYQCDHLVVADGVQFAEKTERVLSSFANNAVKCVLPFNTGGGGYYGHRIFAAFSHLVPDYDYVLFLDQDNWYDPNHVESLVNVCENGGVDFSFSLRKIYDKDKNFLIEDNCESLGLWPVWVDSKTYLVDTSSYCFKVPLLKQIGHSWDFGWGADRRFFHIVRDVIKYERYDCSKMHTLNYRLGGNEGSVQIEFFEAGNKKYMHKFNGELPWKKISS